MEMSTSVQTLIDQFERMAHANAVSSAPRSWSVSKLKKTTQPKADNSPVKKLIQCMNTQRSRTQSEPVQTIQDTNEAVEPEEELSGEEEQALKAAAYKGLTVNTLDKHDTTTSDSILCSMVPRSPSAYSTASTSSLDSLLSSLDLLPELLQAPNEASVEAVVNRSRRSTLQKNLQLATTSKLIPPPTSYRRRLLARKPPSTTTKESSIPVPKSTRRSSKSARVAVVSSPPARTLSNSSSSPKYMKYDSSPRFAATKAWNMERRRQLEERNRSLAANKAKLPSNRTTHTPELQGRRDQVRSRLYDFNEKNQHAARPKPTTSHRNSPRHTHV